MNLSSDLISQFVKTTKDEPTVSKSESTLYGTVVEYDGSNYVKLDGSDLLTPVSTTTDMLPGERVTVLIKNHTATVTGNITSPSARTEDLKDTNAKVDDIGNKIAEFEIVIADKVSVKDFDAQTARIEELRTDNVVIKNTLTAQNANINQLSADNVNINKTLTAQEASIEELQTKKLDSEVADIKYATIEDLEATNLDVHNLEATYGDFVDLTTDKLTAIEAEIKDLDVGSLTVEEADVRYANIDFSNIGEAAIEYFYATSGLIKDVTVGDGTITGELVGVTIKGDLIEGGTVIAEKLVIKGDDGLYYKLNTDGVTTETEQTEYNSLNGSVILANSITATKINVEDLVAFDATIGGFNITDSAIYSGVKESINNSTLGIYLDKTGQIAFGDSNNFVKFYKADDENYRLDISVDTLTIGSEKKTVEVIVDENISTVVNESYEKITENTTNMIKDSETIVLQAVEDTYVKSEEYEDYKSTASAELAIEKDRIDMVFEEASNLGQVDGEILDELSNFKKHISFTADDGIVIGSGDSAIELKIDTDGIIFSKNGVQFGYWDGVDFLTGNIVVRVNERAQFGNFAYVPRSDGSLSFLKVK